VKDFGLFDRSLKTRIGFTRASDISDVPNEPGIYAWYLPLSGDDSGNLLGFLKSLQGNLERTSPATEVSGAGRQRHFSVKRNPPAFHMDSEPVLRLDEHIGKSGLQALSRLVLFLSFLSEPIYIGMTKGSEGIKGRLAQHLQSPGSFDSDASWNGAFNSRISTILNDASILKQCLIAYLPIPSGEIGDDAPRVIEHILIKTICPAMARRG
jgi:hypothetical protein